MVSILMSFLTVAFCEEPQIQFDVEKYQLPNGLTVLMVEDHTSPSFTYHQWFKVGSANEQPGRTGLAHFFEHMMFKGTPKYSSSQFVKALQSNGAEYNAFTSQDYTGYYATLPSSKLELIVDIECDRMRNLLFDPEAINSERKVVQEERRLRTENDVNGILDEAMYKTAYKVHSYRWPIIGSMADLNAASIDDLKSFYSTYYAPNNATVVIVGDFSKSDAKRLIQAKCGAIPSQPIPAQVITPEPEQKAKRSLTVQKPVQSSTFVLAYPIGKAGDEDSYALDLLANVLGEGPSSRLYRKLVYQMQIATAVSVHAWTPHFPGLMEFEVALRPNQSVESAVKQIEAEIKKVKTEPITDLELEKAKNQVMKSFVDLLKTNGGKARALALNQTVLGDYHHLFWDLDRYKAVTKEQVQAVANKYLAPQKQSLIQVTPAQGDAQ